MIELERFATYIHPKVGMCPYELIELELIQAARELCTNAAVWTLESTFDIQCGVHDYQIDTPSCAVPVRVHRLEIGSTPWTGTHPWGGCCRPRSSSCIKFEVIDPTHLRIITNQVVDVEAGALIKVQLQPRADACELPDILFDQYIDAIVYGTLARLHEGYAGPTNPWANPQAGRRNYQLFRLEMTRAKNRLSLGHQAGPLLMTGGYF